MMAFAGDYPISVLVRAVAREDCELIARHSSGGKVSAKDTKHFKDLRERLAGIGDYVVGQCIGMESSMAVFTSGVPQGAEPVDVMWCCAFPAEAQDPDLGIQIALVVSAEGVDLMLRIGAGLASSRLRERLGTLPVSDRESISEILFPKYCLGPKSDLVNLDEWLEKASPGAAISRHVEANELNDFGYEIYGEMRLLAAASTVFVLWHCYDEEIDTGDEAPRVATTVQRIVRSTEVARRVKEMHQHACQVCGLQILTPAGWYAEAAHIRALGRPHSGPDVEANVLCLCPNHHVMFDSGAIYIDDDGTVHDATDHAQLGVLRLVPEHPIDAVQLAYHREQHAR